MSKDRIELEKKVVEQMVSIYCKGHKHGDVPCRKCKELITYAQKRLNLCKFGDNKSFCSKCQVHCFKPDMRTFIKEVMRYSGPRMLLYNPVLALKHFFQ